VGVYGGAADRVLGELEVAERREQALRGEGYLGTDSVAWTG
jgi:hypothetical protein